jgi:hypothetical protein
MFLWYDPNSSKGTRTKVFFFFFIYQGKFRIFNCHNEDVHLWFNMATGFCEPSLASVVDAGNCHPTHPGSIPHGGAPAVSHPGDGKFSAGLLARLEWSLTAQV